MNINDYLIQQQGHDWRALLSAWSWLLPENFTVWLVNRFGDIFLVTDDGSVHMLDAGSGSLTKLAESREDFAQKIDEGNNTNLWLMVPLVDSCVAAGITLKPGHCYGFKIPPSLGGAYSVENSEVTDMSVHYELLGQIHGQLRGVPDGTAVKVAIG